MVQSIKNRIPKFLSDQPSMTLQEHDDVSLLHEITQRNFDALGILFNRYSGLVYGLAHKMLRHPQEAEDLTQEIFLSIWEGSTFSADRGTFRGFLMTKTRSRAIDRLRKKQNRDRILRQWKDAVIPTAAIPNTLEQVEASDQQAAIRLALSALPAHHRQVLELSYFGGYSQTEISRQLNRPLGTIKTWARKGLIQLRQEFHASMEPSSHD